MPYKVTYKDPGEFNKRKAIGVLMPFSSDSVFTSTYNTLEAYKVNLYNFFMTSQGERYLNPRLGSSLLQYLFEPGFTEESKASLQGTILNEIETYFPRLEITQLDIEEYVDKHIYQVKIQFKVRNTELEDNIVIEVSQ